MKSIERFSGISFGADPEFFFVNKKGKVVGSERVIAKKGYSKEGSNSGKIIRDGVQAEFNIRPSTCRQSFAWSLSALFKWAKERAKKKGLDISFKQLVKVDKKELMSLSPESRMFGCEPSYNVYEKDGMSKPVGENPEEYLFRCAGGHIHLSCSYDDSKETLKKTLQNAKELIPIMDIVVGNTCVLMDRGRGNKERRRTYGRAGEYRQPIYGIEYRVLSNFWIRDYKLVSLVLGLCRIAVSVVRNSTKGCNYAKKLRELVKQEDIINAINKNDKKLALKNFNKIKKFLKQILPTNYGLAFDKYRIPKFEKFIKKPITFWFKSNPLAKWTRVSGDVAAIGWERFADGVIHK